MRLPSSTRANKSQTQTPTLSTLDNSGGAHVASSTGDSTRGVGVCYSTRHMNNRSFKSAMPHAPSARHLLTAMAFAVAGVACGSIEASDMPNGDDEQIAAVTQDLFLGPNLTKWSGPVPICFNTRGTSSEVEWMKNALKNSWSAVTPVEFIYSPTCPFAGQAHYIAVSWFHDSGWGVGGVMYSLGVNPSSAINDLTLGYCDTTDCLGAHLVDYAEAFKETVVHEIGHALGFHHEQRRPDYVTLDCPLDDGTGDQNGTVSGGIYLTPDYDPTSVMSYCRGWDGTQPLGYQQGYQGADRLSYGDTHGAQVAYGARLPYWLLPAISP